MRKKWLKPELVVLYRGRPEEAVLGGCKIAALYDGPQAGGADCVGTPAGQQCFVIGGS